MTRGDVIDFSVIQVSRVVPARANPNRALLYRCINNDGDYGTEYAVELQFSNKEIARTWLHNHKIGCSITYIKDGEMLPFVGD